MPKKRRKNKAISSFNSIKNYVRGSKDIRHGFSIARKNCPISLYPDLIKWSANQKHNISPLLGEPFPNKYHKILKLLPPNPLEWTQEIFWAAYRLRVHKQKLNDFILLSSEYEKEFVNSRFSASNEILKTIQNKFGLSFWLIENKIALLQIWKGLEAQKSYVEKVIEESNSGLVPYIAQYSSQRNEESVSIFRLIHRLEEINSDHSVPNGMNNYISYKLFGTTPDSYDELGEILLYDGMSSLIDLYTSFFNICSRLAILEETNEQIEQMHRSLILVSEINNPYLVKTNILNSGDISSYSRLKKRNLTADMSLFLGDEVSAKKHSYMSLKNDAFDYNSIINYARAATVTSDNNYEFGLLKSTAIKYLIDIFELNENAEKSSLALLKLSVNIKYLDISNYLYAYALSFFSDDLPIIGSEMKHLAFRSNSLNPSDSLVLPENIRKKYLLKCKEVYSENYLVDYFISLFGFYDKENHLFDCKGSNLCRLQASIYEAVNFLLHKKPKEVIKLLTSYTHSSLFCYTADYERLIANALIENGLSEQLLRFIVESCFKNHHAKMYLPIKKIFSNKKWDEFKPYTNNILLPIAFHIYSELNTDSASISYLRYSYEEYLWSQDIQKPSELAINTTDTFTKDCLIYYLRYICIPSIIDVGINFDNQADVDKERIEICAKLSLIDKKFSDVYIDEIRSLTTKLMIQQGVEYLDKTRIFVNEENYTKWAIKELEEIFERYLEYQKAGLGENSEGFSDALNSYFISGKAIPDDFLKIPSGNSSDILVDLIISLKEAFLSNTEFGLDSYIGMRIRHGTLSGFVRSPFEQEKITLLLDSSKNKYKYDDYWENKLNLTPESSRTLHKHLSTFSNSIDSLLDETIREYLQINNKSKSNGLFEININAIVFHALREIAQKERNFDSFINECISMFWTLLGPSLINATQYFKDFFISEIVKYTEELDKNVSRSVNRVSHLKFSNILNQASTQAKSSISLISSWFEKPTAKGISASPIEQVIEIALQMMRQVKVGFCPNIRKNVNVPVEIETRSVSILCDVLFIIFENTVKHSGMGLAPNIDLDISLDYKNDIVINVSNQISKLSSLSDIQLKLSKIRTQIENGDYLDSLAIEGGTGLKKIKRIIDPDNLRADSLIFGLDNETYFVSAKLFMIEFDYENSSN